MYVLVRDKYECSAAKRVEKLLTSRPFTFHPINPKQFKKVITIRGDVTEPNLGLSKEDRESLKNNVHVVFHVAACVKFDASFKYEQ